MTHLVNDAAEFADEALEGFVAAYPTYVRAVHGGVVRARRAPEGQVALVVGGGTGHYPAFAGWVGPGLAHASACGNIFASPSASQVYSVIKAAHRGAGVLLSFGNYAGDVLHFGQAAERARGEGLDVRILTVTDDIASGPADDTSLRRGIAGDLTVFKVGGAAAAEGRDLDEVERLMVRANERTRTLGVAFSGCTLPGADAPLFTVPDGHMSVGLGIHGEPGLEDLPRQSADEVAALLVERVLAEDPGDSKRVAVLWNGLGTVKYEELFVGFRAVSRLLADKGYEVVAPQVGELCTSLDMAGVSLTLMWLDDELEPLWTAPCDAPELRIGSVADHGTEVDELDDQDEVEDTVPDATDESRGVAKHVAAVARTISDLLDSEEKHLGDIDAIAGDGDHGIGMCRGAKACADTAEQYAARGAGARTTLQRAADAWAERAGGTSGALWGAALTAAAQQLDDETTPTPDALRRAAIEAVRAVEQLGGAQVGDKTMVDAAAPFRESLESAATLDATTWDAAVEAARAGAESTTHIAARRGRSRAHAEGSIGTPDPGAVSFTLVVERLGSAVPTLDR